MAHDLDDHVIAFPVPAPALAPPPQLSPLRLSLSSEPRGLGALDGGWWPRSRDAGVELAELFKGLQVPETIAVARVSLDLADWDRVPRRILVGGQLLKVGWLPHLDHIVTVTCARRHDLVLLVIPHEAADDAAKSALTMAGAGTAGLPPRQILADCGISPVRATPVRRWGERSAHPGGTDRPRPRILPAESGATWPTATDDRRLRDDPAQLGRWLNDGAPVQPAD